MLLAIILPTIVRFDATITANKRKFQTQMNILFMFHWKKNPLKVGNRSRTDDANLCIGRGNRSRTDDVNLCTYAEGNRSRTDDVNLYTGRDA